MEPERGGSEESPRPRATVVVIEPASTAGHEIRTDVLARAAGLDAGTPRLRVAPLATPVPLPFASFTRLLPGAMPAAADDSAAAIAVDAVVAAIVERVGGGALVVDDVHRFDAEARRVLDRLVGRVEIVATTSPRELTGLAARWDVSGSSVVWLAAGWQPATDPSWPFADASSRRLRRRMDELGADAREWIADIAVVAAALDPAAAAGAPVAMALLDAPPAVLLDERVVVAEDGRYRVVPAGLAAAAAQRREPSVTPLLLAAARCTDAAVASELFAAAGDAAAAAAFARAALTSVSEPDVRARLVARVATAEGDIGTAVSALVERELVEDLVAFAAVVHEMPTAAALAIARVTDDEVARLRLLAQPAGASRAEAIERSRHALVLDGPAPTGPVDEATPIGTSLDRARLLWGLTTIRAAAAGDRATLERQVGAAHDAAPGRPAWLSTSTLTRALVDLHTVGDVAIAPWAGDVPPADEPASWSDRPSLPRAVLDAHRAIALADAGRSGDALALLDVAVRGRAPLTVALRRWALAEVELAAGHPVRALRAGAEQSGPDDDGSLDPGSVLAALAALASLAAAWGAHETGDVAVDVVACTWPSLAPVAMEADALARWRSGAHPAATRDAFLAAAAGWAGVHVRAAVRCRWAAGEVSRRADDLDRAREILAEAEAVALRLGQLPMLSRIRQSLRRAGVRASAHRAAGSGALSAREVEVLQLVGKGLTTRAIAQLLGVGAATVETQVSSAVTKLGARSRLQAALMLQDAPR